MDKLSITIAKVSVRMHAYNFSQLLTIHVNIWLVTNPSTDNSVL